MPLSNIFNDLFMDTLGHVFRTQPNTSADTKGVQFFHKHGLKPGPSGASKVESKKCYVLTNKQRTDKILFHEPHF